jgi:predicted RNase H-like HicB family nuclease
MGLWRKPMKKIIKIEIYHDGEFYCARCVGYDIFTQGQTLDELVHNVKEAVALYFEDESADLEGYDRSPAIFSMMDLGEVHV